MQLFYTVTLLFFCYSFLGWFTETAYCGIAQKHFTNRGFLSGPLCPVYGFGALLVIYLLEPLSENLLALFVGGMLLTSILEYLTGWLLETIFHTKWWDYSQHRFQIHGRVCLLNATLFGILAVIVVRLLHPFIAQFIGRLDFLRQVIIGTVLLTLLAVDLFFSVRAAFQISGKLAALNSAAQNLNERMRAELEKRKLTLESFEHMTRDERLAAILGQTEADRLLQKYEQLQNSRFMQRRILSAFPHMKSKKFAAQLEEFKEAIANWRKKRKKKS